MPRAAILEYSYPVVPHVCVIVAVRVVSEPKIVLVLRPEAFVFGIAYRIHAPAARLYSPKRYACARRESSQTYYILQELMSRPKPDIIIRVQYNYT